MFVVMSCMEGLRRLTLGGLFASKLGSLGGWYLGECVWEVRVIAISSPIMIARLLFLHGAAASHIVNVWFVVWKCALAAVQVNNLLHVDPWNGLGEWNHWNVGG